jgi:hypothetical protein
LKILQHKKLFHSEFLYKSKKKFEIKTPNKQNPFLLNLKNPTKSKKSKLSLKKLSSNNIYVNSGLLDESGFDSEIVVNPNKEGASNRFSILKVDLKKNEPSGEDKNQNMIPNTNQEYTSFMYQDSLQNSFQGKHKAKN